MPSDMLAAMQRHALAERAARQARADQDTHGAARVVEDRHLVGEIVRVVAEHFGVSRMALLSKKAADGALSEARIVATVLAAEVCGLTLSVLADRLNKTTETVSAALEESGSRRRSDQVFVALLATLKERLGARTRPPAWSWRTASVDMVRQMEARRLSMNVSQEAMAREMGIALRSFQRYENHDTEPALSQLFLWASLLGLKIDCVEIF